MRVPRRILVADGPGGVLGLALRGARPELEFRVRHPKAMVEADLDWAQAYIGIRPPRALAFERAELEWVHATGTGVDAYLFDGKLPAGALLTHTRGDFGPRIAEFCLARMLMDLQRIPALLEAQAERRWTHTETAELSGREVLLVGTGRIGTEIARRLCALGCGVRGVSRSGAPNPAFLEVHPVSRIADQIARAEFVILVLPLTAESHHLIDGRALERAAGAFLINVARGPVVDEAALVEALESGRLRGAALDVFEREPLKPDSPVWSLKNTWISPHLAARTTTEEVVEAFLACCDSIEKGEVPELAVDPQRGY